MLVQEQKNVKRVRLAEKYLKEAAFGEANGLHQEYWEFVLDTLKFNLEELKSSFKIVKEDRFYWETAEKIIGYCNKEQNMEKTCKKCS